MAAVRIGTRDEPGTVFGHSKPRPTTDVMAITSLPKAKIQNDKGRPETGQDAADIDPQPIIRSPAPFE